MSYFGNKKPAITPILLHMVLQWRTGLIQKLWRTRSLYSGMQQAKRKRERSLTEEGLLVPFGIGLSPTERCNLECKGCYARFHPRQEEVSIETIERTVAEAAEMGVFLFVITGGEPYLREEMLSIYARFPQVLFITVTNGSLITSDIAKRLKRSGNVIPVVSIEGTREQTDIRRGEGVYAKVIQCMHLLSEHKLIFGFSSVLTKFSIETLGSREFVRSMIELGCAIGFYNDFIPYTRDDRNVLPDKEQMSTFKENLYHIRRREPAVLLHLPEDEYDETGRCSAVGKGSVHINATGDVEPCPFAHFARENITSHSFKDILRSPFLQAIREHPDALIRGEVGCSLFSNYPILEDIAQCTGARCTARSSDCSLQS